MAAKQPIGHMACPECDFPDAEVKEDKNGHPYRYCPDCNAQYFTRGEPGRVAKLRAKMRPARSPEPEEGGRPGTELPADPPSSPPADPPAPRKRAPSCLLDQ